MVFTLFCLVVYAGGVIEYMPQDKIKAFAWPFYFAINVVKWVSDEFGKGNKNG